MQAQTRESGTVRTRGRVDGKVALITGASGGQGAAEARLFAEEGAVVVLTDVADTEGEALAREIASSGARAHYLHLDVRDSASWRAAVDFVERTFGGLHVLVNNAGVVSRAGIMSIDDAEWQRVMDINLNGPLHGMRAVAPLIRDSGGGAIVNISSTAGLLGYAGAAYVSSKWALRGLTKTAAMEFVDWNIRVNSVHPAQVADTAIARNATAPYREVTARVIPMGRGARSIEVANVVLFLASDESSYVTGTEIAVDAGYSSFALPRLRESLVKEALEREQAAGGESRQGRTA
jgi:3alpha(or 20beta)-hydroxysteroid dehydrogenase